LISWRRETIEAGVGSSTPHWEEPLARKIFFQPPKEVIDEVLRRNDEILDPIREDEQADSISGQVRHQVFGYPLPGGAWIGLQSRR
jgi:hypothetical protein